MTLDINEVYNMDCLKGMKKLPDNSIDLVLTDPPYNISLKNNNISRTTFRTPIIRRDKALNYDFGDWDNKDREEFLEFTENWLKECCRVLKKDCAIISFFNKEDISFLGWIAKRFGVRTRTIFSWHKTNPVPSFRKVNYLSSTEFIWIGSKGKFETFNFKTQKEMHNFFETANGSAYKVTKHPTEKPLNLIEHFISIHSNKSDIILDCFLGSGTTAEACLKLQRNFIGFEIDEHYFKIAQERIKPYLNQARLDSYWHKHNFEEEN